MTPTPVAVTVTVAAPCAEPGGAQTVIVTSRPGLQVTVDPRYADGRAGNVYGGFALAQTIGSDGAYRETWTLPPDTPLGRVFVDAGVASTSGARAAGTGTASFIVAAHC